MKKNRRKNFRSSQYLILLVVALVLVVILSRCSLFKGEQPPEVINIVDDVSTPVFADKSNENEEIVTETEKLVYAGDNVPISRALVAKMLSFVNNDKNSINIKERVIKFSDTNKELWYDRYVNAVVEEKLMSGGGDVFMGDKPLTLEHAQFLLNKIDDTKKIKIEINDENKNRAISYALWVELYYKALTNSADKAGKSVKEMYGIYSEDIIVLATPDNNELLTDWNMITSKGHYSYKGLSLKEYIDKKISVLIKDGEIIAFLGVKDYTPIVENAYIVGLTESSITIFIGGAERTYIYDTSNIKSERICDIKINGNNAEKVTVYDKSITGVVKKVNDTMIELEGKGQINLADNYSVYSVVDGVPKWKSLTAVTVGTDISEFILKDNKIVAIIISKTTLPSNIRVALSQTGFSGLIHDKVEITSNKKFTVTIGDKTKTYKSGQVYKVAKNDFSNNVTRVYLAQCEKDGKFKINTIERNGVIPEYRGKIEIGFENEGYSIVNELSMDEYLYAVVPSEMPSSYGVEAAKVQAVTARSYAYNQYYVNRYNKYGANVDDSVNSQVYNNTPENETSIKAVNETSGICLVYNNEVISANFFSTSSGSTANSGEVWQYAPTNEVPFTPEYLQAVKQYTKGDYGDLSKEENSYKFLKDKDVEAYDSQFGWFRWNVVMTAEELSNSINSELKARYDANKNLIRTLNNENKYVSTPVKSIGQLKDLVVTKRGIGGNIIEIKIVGTEATVLVTTEYNIRTLLKPKRLENGKNDIVLNMKDGTEMVNYSLMPSSFFVMDKVMDKDKLKSITFFGGGNGHGVGMSQNGVKGMINKGFTFGEILKHFYKNTEVKKMI